MAAQKNTEQAKRRELAEIIYKAAPALISLVVVLVVAAIGVWGYSEFQAKKEREAQSDLYAYESQMENVEKSLYEEAAKKLGDKVTADVPNIEKSSQTFDKNFSTIVGSYEQTLDKHLGTKAAAISALFLASKYTEYGLPEKAEGVLAKAKSKTGNDILKALIVLQDLAHADSGEKCQQRQGELDQILAQQNLKFLWAEAYLRKATCAVGAGSSDVAQDALRKLNEEFPKSQASRKAQVLERLLAVGRRPEAQK